MYSTKITSLIVIGCWLVWAFYWVINVKNSKVTTQPQATAGRNPYVLLLFAAFVLLLADTHSWPILERVVIGYSVVIASIAAAICVIGVAITIWARRALADNWSAYVVIKKDHKLVTDGPYRLVRHPIYTGLLGLSLGTAIIQGTSGALIGLICAIASCLIKLEQEEQLMLKHFGEKYKKYQAQTKRLIPFLF